MAMAHAKKKLAVEKKLALGANVVTDERAHVIFDGVHMRIPDQALTGGSLSQLQAGFEHAIGTGAGGISTALRGVDYSLEYAQGPGLDPTAAGPGLASQIGLGSSISVKMPYSTSLQVSSA